MADPTIQTFCCHHVNDSPMAISIMEEFNTRAYNAVCIASSTLGLVGAVYQILPRKQVTHTHRWLSFSAVRGRQIIVWLAMADLMASLGIFIRSVLWMNNERIMPRDDDSSSVIFCAVASAWTQYFYMATWIWTLCYAIDMRLVLKERPGHPKLYHSVAWILPAVLTFAGLSLLYIPDANCHSYQSLSTALTRVLPNYLATYVPIAAVMVANPILYVSSSGDVARVVHRTLGQVTRRERDIIDAIRLKFSLINAAFYLCWLPNLLNGVLLWTLWFRLPVRVIVAVWYAMAVTNPLQALLNSVVYRRWGGAASAEMIVAPWRRVSGDESVSNGDGGSSPKTSPAFAVSEELPLLQSVPRNSINGYSSI